MLVRDGLVLQFESETGVLAPGGTVSSWADGSGLGNDLTAVGDPQLVAARTPAGRPAVVFDGDGDVLQRNLATEPLSGLPQRDADRTMFIVADYIAPEGVFGGAVYGDGEVNQAFGLVAQPNGELTVQGFGSANDFDSGRDGVAPGWLVQSAVLQDGVLTQFVDGDPVDTLIHRFNTDAKRIALGGEIAGRGESQVEIAAVVLYDRALDAAERAEAEAYLQETYIGALDFTGGPEGERIVGRFGDDTLFGGGGDDDIRGRQGDDRIDGGVNDDLLVGNAGDDDLRGNWGADRLFGNAGRDRLFGDGGPDILNGGPGNDAFRGGFGADTFVVAGNDDGTEFVFDFISGQDKVRFDDFELTKFGIAFRAELVDGNTVIDADDDGDVDLVLVGYTEAFTADDIL